MSNETNGSKLLDYQCEQLLKEFELIISEKWQITNQNGVQYIRGILDHFSYLFDSNESKEETDYDEEISRFTPNDKLGLKNLKVLQELNENFNKLNEILKNFDFYLQRLKAIRSNLSKMIESSSSTQLVSQIEPLVLKQVLNEICNDYHQENSLKQKIVNEFIHQSKFDQDSRIALLSCWIHEPYLNDHLKFQIKHFIQNYNKK